MPDLANPSTVAQILDVSPTTVRRMTARYASQLSEHTRRRPRQYTQEDVAVLFQALELRQAEGLTVEEVQERFDAGTIALPAAPVERTASTDNTDIARVATSLERLVSHLERQEDLQGQVERLQAEVDDLRRRIGTPLLWMVLGAVIMGVIAAGIAISLISLAG